MFHLITENLSRTKAIFIPFWVFSLRNELAHEYFEVLVVSLTEIFKEPADSLVVLVHGPPHRLESRTCQQK